MKRPSLGWMQLLAVSITGLVAIIVLIDGLRGGIQRGSTTAVVVGAILAAAIFAGGFLVAMRKGRAGMLVLLGALGAWIAWVVVTAPETFDGQIIWWAALGIAAALASRQQRTEPS